jgi:phosphoglycerol transferase
MQLLWSLLPAMLALLWFSRNGGAMGRVWHRLFAVLTGVFSLFVSIFLFADYFTNRGIDDSVVFHLAYGLGGAGFSEYAWLIGLGILLLVTVFFIPVVIWRKQFHDVNRARPYAVIPPFFLMVFAIVMQPATGNLFRIAHEPVTDLNFSDFYRVPSISVQTQNRKNLVFIYLEGMEWTFFDEQRFPGLTPELNGLFAGHTVFTDIDQAPNTSWTIAGMIASQCGIPLHFPSHGNSLSGLDRILPDSRCLGDLLSEQGYSLSFHGGADLGFAGKGKFLRSHGFKEVLGRMQLRELLPDPGYQSGWGLFDDSLLDIAYDHIAGPGKEKPYAAFILTLDTHPPSGHPSRSCDGRQYREGGNAMLNAVACSDFLTAGFIRQLMSSPSVANTLIIVMSDHLAMRNTATHLLTASDRRILFAVLDPENPRQASISTPGTVLDIAPTVLGFMGAQTEIGLGRDLSRMPSVSRSVSGFYTAIKAWKPEIMALWSFPALDGGVLIDPLRKQVEIDKRRFGLPVLIEYDEDLNSQLFFEFDGGDTHPDLKAHYRETPARSGVIWVDACASLKSRSGFPPGTQCILTGRKGGGPMAVRQLDGELRLSAEELRVF